MPFTKTTQHSFEQTLVFTLLAFPHSFTRILFNIILPFARYIQIFRSILPFHFCTLKTADWLLKAYNLYIIFTRERFLHLI